MKYEYKTENYPTKEPGCSLCNHINKKMSKSKVAFIRQVYNPGDGYEFDWDHGISTVQRERDSRK